MQNIDILFKKPTTLPENLEGLGEEKGIFKWFFKER